MYTKATPATRSVASSCPPRPNFLTSSEVRIRQHSFFRLFSSHFFLLVSPRLPPLGLGSISPYSASCRFDGFVSDAFFVRYRGRLRGARTHSGPRRAPRISPPAPRTMRGPRHFGSVHFPLDFGEALSRFNPMRHGRWFTRSAAI